MRSKTVPILSLAIFAFVAGNLVFFSVDETQYAVVTQFGEPVKAITRPGLQWKWPEPVQSVTFYDNRIMVLSPDKAEYLTSDKKNIIVENYVAWRVEDPVQYLKSLQERSRAETRLTDIVSSELGTALGKQDLTSLVTTEAGAMKLPAVLEEVGRASDAQAQKYGIRVADVRAKLLNFPEKNRLSVFSRMKSERERIARKYRSEGSEEASKIRAEAEREQRVIISEAYAKAEKLRGEGDAEAIRIYAEAYGKDPEFYRFVRTLESYGKFIDDKTTVVLPANSELLKYLNEVQARPQGQAPNQAQRPISGPVSTAGTASASSSETQGDRR
ncbi:MAG TPA: protease modulator HflC [Dehalococcoidia bacterium]|nr:protease modulator HflC [Dehalococcoidia bacterium]